VGTNLPTNQLTKYPRSLVPDYKASIRDQWLSPIMTPPNQTNPIPPLLYAETESGSVPGTLTGEATIVTSDQQRL
jgi:hypothetical protein